MHRDCSTALLLLVCKVLAGALPPSSPFPGQEQRRHWYRGFGVHVGGWADCVALLPEAMKQ